MHRTSPLTYDLASTEKIWVRPNETCTIYMDFGVDVSGWTFVLFYSEHKWPYMPYSYDELVPGEIDAGFTFTDNDIGTTNSVTNLTIDEVTVNSWRDRNLDIRLQVNDGTNTWIAADRTLVVAQGE